MDMTPDEFTEGNTILTFTHDGLVPVDEPIAPLVAALNHVPNVQTLYSCCGHRYYDAYILFTALDGNVDALMHSDFVQALSREPIMLKREIILAHLPLGAGETLNPAEYDRFVLEFVTSGDEAKAIWYQRRNSLITLCQEHAKAPPAE